MSLESEFIELLSCNETLFQYISTIDDTPLPCMDIVYQLIDKPDYYGVNFTQNPVIKLFFTEQSTYFPALFLIENVQFDQLPIYIIDLSSSNKTMNCVGNLREYITILLEFCIDHVNEGDLEMLAEFDVIADVLQKTKELLSTTVIKPISEIKYFDVNDNYVFSLYNDI